MFSLRAVVRFRAVFLLLLLGLTVSRAEAVSTPDQPYQTGTASSTSVTMAWNRLSDACGYHIDNITTGASQDINYNPSQPSATFNGLAPSTSYTFSVRALDCSGGSGDESPQGSGTTTSSGGGGGGSNPGSGSDRISGRITFGGTGLSNVVLDCRGGGEQINPRTDANGYYSFAPHYDATYTITPDAQGYTFGPTNPRRANKGQDGVDFTASRAYKINVLVKNSAGNPLPNISFAVSRGPQGVYGGYERTGSDGRCALTWPGADSGPYTITPFSNDYIFDPPSPGVSSNNTYDSPLTFTATLRPPKTYTISGQVTTVVDNAPKPVSGIQITRSGSSESATTGGDGKYQFSNVPIGNYTLTPNLPTGTFDPTSKTADVSNQDVTGTNFTIRPSGKPTIKIEKPRDPTELYPDQPLGSVNGTADAGAGLHITHVFVYIAREPLASNPNEPRAYWCSLGNDGNLGWAATDAPGQKFMLSTLMPASPNQHVAWKLEPHQIPPADQLDEQHKYTVFAKPRDNADRLADDFVSAKFNVVEPMVTIGGNITTQLDGKGVAGVKVNLSGKTRLDADKTAQVVTTANGSYQFLEVPAGHYTIGPELAPGTFTPVPRTITVFSQDAPAVNFQILDALPKVIIKQPGDRSVLKPGQALDFLSFTATAGAGRKIRSVSVYLVRQKGSASPEYWGLLPNSTSLGWLAAERTLRTIILPALPAQQVSGGVPKTLLPPASQLSSEYQYHAKATATDDRDRNPANGREGDKFTRNFFTVEAPVYQLTLTSIKPVICAGGLNSAIHQTHLTVTLQDQSRKTPSEPVVFTWNVPGLGKDGPQTVKTNAAGQAVILLTSGDEVGNVTVTATAKGKTATKTIEIAPADGTMLITPKEVVADGKSRFTLTLPLRLQGAAVGGHRISWRVTKMEDEQGNPVMPNRFGDYVGYGSLEKPLPATAIITNANGNAVIHYTVGTKAGTVYFEALDLSVFEASSASGQVAKVSLDKGVAPASMDVAPLSVRRNKPYTGTTKPTGLSDIVIQRDGKTVTAEQEVIVGQRINLKVVSTRSGVSPTAITWTVGGYKKASYVPTLTFAKPVDLTPAQFKQSSISFFWFDGGRVAVQCNATIDGKARSKRITFKIQRPEPEVTTLTGAVKADPKGVLTFSGDLSTLGSGITFGAEKLGAFQSRGEFCWVQQVLPNGRKGYVAGNITGGSWWHAPLSGVDANPPDWAYAHGTITGDSPRQGIGVRLQGSGSTIYAFSNVQVRETFLMWFMFRPNGPKDQTAWVPLSVVQWQWGGNLDYIPRSGRLYQASGLFNTPKPRGVRSGTFPEWTQRVDTTLPWVQDAN